MRRLFVAIALLLAAIAAPVSVPQFALAQQQAIGCGAGGGPPACSPSNTSGSVSDSIAQNWAIVNSNESQLFGALGPSSNLATHGSIIFSDIVSLWSGCSGTMYLGADGNCHSGGGGGSGTVNSGAQYALGYYAAAGTAISQIANGTTGQYLCATTGAAPGWCNPTSIDSLTNYTTPASGDELAIYSASGAVTDKIHLSTLFGSVPAPLSLNPGATSAASWTINGERLSGTAATFTDTTATGTVTTEAFNAFPADTLAATNASVTVTNLAELYLPIPVAGTNVTATNKWSAYLAGGEYIVGSLQVQSQITDNGPFIINTGNISHSSWTVNGLLIEQETGTLTDTSGTGTIATEAMIGLAGSTLAASNSGVTVTNLAQVYIGAPAAGTNVTATNKWSLDTVGNILDGGYLSLANGTLDSGTTFTLGTGTGACSSTGTLTGGAVTGSFKCTGTAGASTQIINMPSGVAKNGWHCSASDATSGVAWANEIDSATAAKIAGTITTTSDVVTFHCDAY